jgi:NADH:ubiquinone oxidoreductase subunit 6 (subunit J)
VTLARNLLLAAATLGSALWLLLAQRPRGAHLALGLNALCLAGLCWALSAPLLGSILALAALAAVWMGWSATEDAAYEAAQGPALPADRALAVAVGVVAAATLAGALYVEYAPGQMVLLGEASVTSLSNARALGAALFDRHGLSVVVLGLIVVAVWTGQRILREDG